ncbi:MAG: FIST C-terminal domain-containing protein [Burkholderiales bacterium]|nr:FIST C-terminal domain-containing protein [Burkholderiales bacterium]
MPTFHYSHSANPDWRRAADACLTQLGTTAGSLGFLYAADCFASELGPILEQFKRSTGVEHWVGTVGTGVLATGREYVDQPALCVMLGELDAGAFRVFSGIRTSADVAAVSLRCEAGVSNFAIVHADPTNSDVAALVSTLAGKVESGFLVGGLTSSRKLNPQIADGISAGGLSGVVFTEDVAIATRLTQGCSPIGPKHTITECQRNIILSLDGKPALDVMREDLGERFGKELNRLGGQIFVGLPVKGSDTGDYLVRNLLGIDPQSKLVAIGDLIQTGQQIMFCRRDLDSAAEDMNRMLESIKKGLFGKPRGGLYYSCVARGPNLFGTKSEELGLIRDALGEFPLVGFFGNGEISHNRLYGYTGVLTLFV